MHSLLKCRVADTETHEQAHWRNKKIQFDEKWCRQMDIVNMQYLMEKSSAAVIETEGFLLPSPSISSLSPALVTCWRRDFRCFSLASSYIHRYAAHQKQGGRIKKGENIKNPYNISFRIQFIFHVAGDVEWSGATISRNIFMISVTWSKVKKIQIDFDCQYW